MGMEGAEPGWTVAEARMDTGRIPAGQTVAGAALDRHWPEPGWTDSGQNRWPEPEWTPLAAGHHWPEPEWTLAGAEQPGWPVAGAAERGADPELDTVAIF